MKKIYFSIILIFLLTTVFFIVKKIEKPVIEQENKVVTFYNWKEYTDISVLTDFERETGIKVTLYEYETMPMMIAEVHSNPGKYDVIVMDGNIVSVMKELKLIEELDLNRLPDYKNVKEELRKKPFYDHQGRYSVPHLWGTTGLVYNTDYVGEPVNSWKVLWNKKYKGKIALMNDPREVMAVLLKSSGYSLNSKKPEELKIAEQQGLLLKENGVKFGETIGNIEKVISGELWIAEVYNGDVFYKTGNKKNIKFVNPGEGFNLWSEYICLCSDASNKEGAYKLINYFLRPDVSARFTNTFCNVSPIAGSERYIKKEILENPVIYLSEDIFSKGEFYIDVGDTNKEYERIFNLLK
ncbi:MAG: spermidine/putrescine ABC transporter substrate-binding protein [Candidatus Eremiobacterota bacterium]